MAALNLFSISRTCKTFYIQVLLVSKVLLRYFDILTFTFRWPWHQQWFHFLVHWRHKLNDNRKNNNFRFSLILESVNLKVKGSISIPILWNYLQRYCYTLLFIIMDHDMISQKLFSRALTSHAISCRLSSLILLQQLLDTDTFLPTSWSGLSAAAERRCRRVIFKRRTPPAHPRPTSAYGVHFLISTNSVQIFFIWRFQSDR